ncbi:Metallo-dependent phosphatase [Dendrothele bispora CBS 962.96]|uniref:Metallo-dependent phosphatase n=1 Tax=Dendrothele bispora (strain CBS 962.96) TaxID=1314807 RepID=A0A4S8MVQ2_DENBC|nr:Metallo-dependent phosphatase [Dendrothele bispora CBS 962.96]
MSSVRRTLCYTALAVSLVFFLFSDARNEVSDAWSSLVSGTPDFSKYVDVASLNIDEFPLDDENRRVIVVGDIHGMHEKLLELLSEVSFDPLSDVLVSVGDILAKGPHSGSMAVLDFMVSNNVTAVRGNHDQKVIEWRSWMNWIQSMPGGRRWLDHAIQEWHKAQKKGEDDVQEWVTKKMKYDIEHRKWWRKIPQDWKFLGDHFKIAKDMTAAHYQYLVSLPLKIHIPHAHTFIVHAGLLASDPKYLPSNSRQPLARAPKVPKHLSTAKKNSTLGFLRLLQEQAILTDVPQNTVPWNVLNMRGVTHKKHRITRDNGEGKPWSKLYKKDMAMCKGFDTEEKHTLPCMPATVIYGHAASRGLDIKRWSIGLDTGCVYNRRLTALVLGGQGNHLLNETEDILFGGLNEFGDNFDGVDYDNVEEDEDEDEDYSRQKKTPSKIRFGDNGWARLVSIGC